jgi:hypothetical protein
VKDWKKRLRKWNETMITEQEIRKSTKEELKSHINNLQEEIDKVIDNKDSVETFRELIRLRILCLLQYHKEEAMKDIL